MSYVFNPFTGNFDYAGSGSGSATVTSVVAYTPIFTGFGTVSDVNFRSYRVGSYLHVEGTFTSGTPTATEARIEFGFNGTSGNVDSASDLQTISLAGFGARASTSNNDIAVLIEPSVNYFTFSLLSTGTFQPLTKQLADSMFTSQSISIRASVHIDGW